MGKGVKWGLMWPADVMRLIPADFTIPENIWEQWRDYRRLQRKINKALQETAISAAILPPCMKCHPIVLHYCGVTGIECRKFRRYIKLPM